jgi:hypothetical protein
VSSRRNTPLVVALGVAALAGTSLAAMVATSELLVESFGRPVSDRLDPPLPDLGSPKVIQVEPPEPGRVGPPGGRSRPPKAAPPPRRRSAAGSGRETDRGGVVVAVQRRPARSERVAVRGVALDRPAPPAAPPDLEPAERPRPRRHRHTRPRKRWIGPKPHHHPRIPVAPRPHTPRPAGPGDDPRGGSPCHDRPPRDGDHHRWDRRRHWRDRDGRSRDRDRSRGGKDRRGHDEHGHHHRGHWDRDRDRDKRWADGARDRRDRLAPQPTHRQNGWPAGSR